MIISLVKNISYYMQEKKRGKAYKDVPEYNPSHGEFYTEECPVYDNLNHHQQDVLNESYYEQMNAHSQTSSNEVQEANNVSAVKGFPFLSMKNYPLSRADTFRSKEV
ncbi:UNVERIFIED_CONTAM: hypothetical protein K2H54_060946 [Gekko kuhli]